MKPDRFGSPSYHYEPRSVSRSWPLVEIAVMLILTFAGSVGLIVLLMVFERTQAS